MLKTITTFRILMERTQELSNVIMTRPVNPGLMVATMVLLNRHGPEIKSHFAVFKNEVFCKFF
jgi:hypothetical protein